MGKVKSIGWIDRRPSTGRKITLINETRRNAKNLEARLISSLPGQWSRGIRELALQGRHELPAGAFKYEVDANWLAKLSEFEAAHGDALRWNLCDAQICEKAKTLAREVTDFLTDFVTMRPDALPVVERMRRVAVICEIVGVPEPVALTDLGYVERAMSDVWWRRELRKKIARLVEHGAIKLGVVTRSAGAYASDGAVIRRKNQLARNAAMLAKAVMRNEAGQCFTLAELAKSATSNQAVRGDELMTRVRGCEEYALEHGHVGTFWALTTPSRFHPVLVGGKTAAAKPRKNPKYDGVSTPREAQLWLRTQWARARSELAREGIRCYGFRVAEPHHDGTPHWHAMLWFESELAMHQGLAIIGSWWMKDGGREAGAHEHRVNVKLIEGKGAAAYIAKYVAKNIGHYDVGQHLDTLDGLEAAVWAGDVQGWQRVDAWAATWGIRQFQSIGQPSVSVWREMRRVTKDQVDEAWQMGGDALPQKIHQAVHRHSEVRDGVVVKKDADIMACWRSFLSLMGGHCVKRADAALKLAKRVNDVVNVYSEAVVQKKVVGLVMASGQWLVSRRQSWVRVIESPVVSPASRAALAAPWSGFNNCTARLTGALRRVLLDPSNRWYGGVMT